MEKNFICRCYSPLHQVIFWSDPEFKFLVITIHLIPQGNFFRRLYVGLRYAFVCKSNMGEYDEFIFKDEDKIELLNYLSEKKS